MQYSGTVATVQYSSQITSFTGTREYHNGAPCEAPMLTCLAQYLRVTAWITTSHASIFTRQQDRSPEG